jgi:hypothetical protein
MPTARNLILFALLLSGIPARADSKAYIESSNQSGAVFGTVDLSTGAFQQIGPGLSDLGFGLAPLNGLLYTMGGDGVLNTIKPSTGVETAIGASLGSCSNPGVSPCGANSALGFGALNGVLYATDFANNLYTINAATGKATLVGPTGMTSISFVPALPGSNGTWTGADESLFAAGGKLYANEDFVTINPASPHPVVGVVLADALYQIDTTTGKATLIAPTLTPLNAFANVNGTEYAFDGNLGEIVSVNLTNGNTTFVSNYDPSAGLISGAAAVPEPVSVGLGCIGMAVLAVLKRKRRRGPLSSHNKRGRTGS